MESNDPKQEIKALTEEINRHTKSYYIDNAPTISDFEFDKLLRRLQELEAQYPEYQAPDSPTQKVGSSIGEDTPFKKYPHKHPMLSLSNTYNIGELKEFDDKVQKLARGKITYNCELKFDGTGINLFYKNGKLTRALTRGDGAVGEDVTKNVATIKTIPSRLKGNGYPEEFEIRGEIYMPFAAFDALNAEKDAQEEPLMANPRNAAAGSLKIQDASVVATRGLQCVLYHLIADKMPSPEHSTTLKMAAEWGLPISEYSKECNNINEVIEYINLWDEKRKTLPFPTDGMVVKVNNFAEQASIGYTAKSPRWAVAYKFKPEEALTKVESVVFQVSRAGTVTPVANLCPVLLSGTMVKRATLHNAEQIKLLGLHINDYVYVEKGGEIIPKITRIELSKREEGSKEVTFPAVCPSCGATLMQEEDEARIYCPNIEECEPQIEGKILHFCSRKALNINLGVVAIHQLYKRGFVTKVEDLYSVSDLQLLTLDGWKGKSVDNLLASLEKSKTIPFDKVLYGLGIRYVGPAVAQALAEKFHNIDNIISASKEDLAEIDGLGISVTDYLIEYFKDERHIKTIENLKKAGLQFQADNKSMAPASDELQGLTIMITGNYTKPREEMKLYIKTHGGAVGSGVTQNTDCLLAGTKPGEEKIKKADRLNIPIITEEEFYKGIDDNSLKERLIDIKRYNSFVKNMKEKKVTNRIFYLGVNDRRTALFENNWPLPQGVSYNSYLIKDEKNVLIDSVGAGFGGDYFERVDNILNGEALNYLVINHVEPDHSALAKEILQRYKGVKIIGNKKTFELLQKYYGIEADDFIEITDNQEINIGSGALKFVFTAWVHWPETMVTLDVADGVLFSCDAFGGFGTLDGGIFDGDYDLSERVLPEMRRYYSNIVAKWSIPVLQAIDKLKEAPIKIIAPSHGVVWKKNPQKVIDSYATWAAWKPENGAVIAYASMYGNTERLADYLGGALYKAGIKSIKTFDVSKTNASYILSEILRYKGLLLGSCAYNGQMHPMMEHLCSEIKIMNPKNKVVGIFGTSGWNGMGARKLEQFAQEAKLQVVKPTVEAFGAPTPTKTNEATAKFVEEFRQAFSVTTVKKGLFDGQDSNGAEK